MPKQTFFNLPEEKREHILSCAVREFADRGYKLASISRMVVAAGIAKGSFYQYFEDKDDLYEHIVCTLIADRKLRTYERLRDRLKDLSLTGYLRIVFREQLEEFQRQPDLLRIGLDILQNIGTPIYQRILSRYQGEYNTYYLPYIQHEVSTGEIDARVNAQLLNFMLVSLGQYIIFLMTSPDGADLTQEMIDKIVDDLDYIFTNGIYTELTPRE